MMFVDIRCTGRTAVRHDIYITYIICRPLFQTGLERGLNGNLHFRAVAAEMAKIEDLKEVLKETLENRGVLGPVRARIRAEVFNALDEPSEMKPTLSNENFLINELIREYLEFNKYKYASSVLTVEAGQPKDPMDKRYLIQELNIEEDLESSKLPILYGMLSHFLHRGENSKGDYKTGEKDHGDSNVEAQDYYNSAGVARENDTRPKSDCLITYKN